MAIYLTDTDLLYQIRLSKGKGHITPELDSMLFLLSQRLISKMRYDSDDDRYDCMMSGYLMLRGNWHKFDELTYSKPFVYFTQICKMGMAAGHNQLIGKRHQDNYLPKFVRMTEKNSYMI